MKPHNHGTIKETLERILIHLEIHPHQQEQVLELMTQELKDVMSQHFSVFTLQDPTIQDLWFRLFPKTKEKA